MEEKGKKFTGFSKEEAENIRYIVSDVDDTITTDGLLIPEALRAMYEIKKTGRKLILVTGGSAGWADGYIRQWPVDAVIAESGAVLLARVGGRIRYYMNPMIEADPDMMERRKAFMEETGSGCFSSDQYARIFDIAYERCAMDGGKEKALLSLVKERGAKALVSSIHVNVLFADLSKAAGIETFHPLLCELLGIEDSLETFLSHSLSLGDSTNDEALFERTGISVGNKRVADGKAGFTHLPTYITDKYGGESFFSVLEKLFYRNY